MDLTVIRDFPLAMLSADAVASLETMSVTELRRALSESLAETASSLVRLAMIVRILDDRGEDVSDLRLPLLTYLRLIAHGQLLPELVARFAENPPLIRQLSYLPLKSQKEIATGELVRLVVRNGDGYTHRLAEPSKLDMQQRNQVFARDHIRSDEEQILWLEGRNRQATPAPKRRVSADPKRGGVMVGRNFATRAEILDALAELTGPAVEANMDAQLVVKLSEAEHRCIRIAAAESGRTMQDLCRAAMRAAALI